MELLKIVLQMVGERARDSIADRLKEGAANEEKVRQMIQRELKEIKDSLKDLARKDLRSSVTFFGEGIMTMEDYKSTNDETSLSHAMDCFNQSIICSTQAFENVSLSTQERVHATNIKISATLLKLQKNPQLALKLSVECLHKLCELNTVKKAFQYKSGWRRMLANKLEADIRQEVYSLKHAVYQYILSNKSTLNLEWPLPDWHVPYNFIDFEKFHEHGRMIGLTSDLHTVVTITPDLSCRLVDVCTGDVVREFQVIPGFRTVNKIDLSLNLGFAQDPVTKLMYFAMWDGKRSIILQVYDEEGKPTNCYEVTDIDVDYTRFLMCLKIYVAGDKIVVTNCDGIWLLILTTEDKCIVSSRRFYSWITGCAIIGEEIYLSEERMRNDKLLVLNMKLEDSHEVFLNGPEECSVRVREMAYDSIRGQIIIASSDVGNDLIHAFTKQGDHLEEIKLNFKAWYLFVGPTGRILIGSFRQLYLLLVE